MKAKTKIYTITITPEIIYVCPTCGSAFCKNKYLLEHMPEHYEEADYDSIKFKFLRPE